MRVLQKAEGFDYGDQHCPECNEVVLCKFSPGDNPLYLPGESRATSPGTEDFFVCCQCDTEFEPPWRDFDYGQ